MLRLRSNSHFSKIIEIDPKTGELNTRKIVDLDANNNLKINGFFEYLDGIFAAIYLISGQLMLRVDNLQIPITSDLKADLRKHGEVRNLFIKKANTGALEINYQVNEHLDPNDPTIFIDEEHFDFGLYVTNIINKPKRQAVLIDNWS